MLLEVVMLKLSRVLWLYKSEVKLLSHVQLFATPCFVAYQASLSMGFSRQEYWSRLLFPSGGDFPDPGIEPTSPELAGIQGGTGDFP